MTISPAFRRGLVLAACLTAVVSADEAYVLAKPELPAAGTVIETTSKSAMIGAKLKMSNGDGKTSEATVDQTDSLELKVTIVSPEKVRYEISKSEKSWSMTMDGHTEKPDEPPSPLLGVPLVSELKDGKWTTRPEDSREADEGMVEEMKDYDAGHNLVSEQALYGTEARKPGDKWEVDLSKLDDFESLKKPSGKLSAEFVKIDEAGGEKCAEIVFTFDLKGTDGSEGKIHSVGTKTAHRSLKDLINLDEKTSMKVEGEGTSEEWKEMKVTGNGTMETTSKVTKP